MANSKILPGAKRWGVGDLTVTVLNDGWFQGSLDLVTGIAKEEAGALQRAGFRTEAPRVTLNAFLVTGPGRKPVMIDTGYGGQITKHYLTELRVAPTRSGDLPAS